MFRSWNVLRGSLPERRRLVMIPFNDDTVQLIKRRMMPITVPSTYRGENEGTNTSPAHTSIVPIMTGIKDK